MYLCLDRVFQLKCSNNVAMVKRGSFKKKEGNTIYTYIFRYVGIKIFYNIIEL